MERPTECVALPTTARSNAEIPSCKLLSSGLGLHRSASWDTWRWPGTNGEMTLPPFSHSLGVGCWLGAKALFPISDRIERSGFFFGTKGQWVFDRRLDAIAGQNRLPCRRGVDRELSTCSVGCHNDCRAWGGHRRSPTACADCDGGATPRACHLPTTRPGC